jgi:hypothetical protein
VPRAVLISVRYIEGWSETKILVEARKIDEAVELSAKLAGGLEAEVGR